jgi:hypothetical protein
MGSDEGTVGKVEGTVGPASELGGRPWLTSDLNVPHN